MFNRNVVEPVDDFMYLGFMQSCDGYCRCDVRQFIGLASSVTSSLRRVYDW